ncbi:MAG: hypothetical protein JNJ46_26545 [Myxococcales bacterium]|nr:hypothetical protein [Myxococcales bacterium]
MLEAPSNGEFIPPGTHAGSGATRVAAAVLALYGAVAGLLLYILIFPSGAAVAMFLLAALYLPLFMGIGGLLGGLLGFLIGPKLHPFLNTGPRRRLAAMWLAMGLAALLLLRFVVPHAVYAKLSCWLHPGACTLEPDPTRAMTALEKAKLDTLLNDRARWAHAGIKQCNGHWCQIDLSGVQDADILSVYGRANHSVWAVQSSGSVVRFTHGKATVTGDRLRQIHGCGPSAYGFWERTVYRWVDDRLVPMDIPWSDAIPSSAALKLTAIAGCSDADLWFLGEHTDSKTLPQTLVLHYDGQHVRSMLPRSMAIRPTMIGSDTPGQAWLLGTKMRTNQPAILRFDHGTWTALPTERMSDAHMTAVLGLGNSLLAVGALAGAGVAYFWDGRSFQETTIPSRYAIRAVRAAFEGGAWALGEYNTVYRWDHESWSRQNEPLPDGTGRASLLCLHSSEQTLWVGGSSGLLLRRSQDPEP